MNLWSFSLSHMYIWLMKESVHEMLKFAQDLRTCRKVAFAKVGLRIL